jgi:hypothetical protein
MTFANDDLPALMKLAAAVLAIGALALPGCARMDLSPEPEDQGARMKHAAQAYTDCVTRAAERNMQNPLGAEDIAVAAHAQCWTEWDGYRVATRATFFDGAGTRDELQMAGDKTDAHLRQFERDTRRSLVDYIVERTLSKRKAP